MDISKEDVAGAVVVAGVDVGGLLGEVTLFPPQAGKRLVNPASSNASVVFLIDVKNVKRIAADPSVVNAQSRLVAGPAGRAPWPLAPGVAYCLLMHRGIPELSVGCPDKVHQSESYGCDFDSLHHVRC